MAVKRFCLAVWKYLNLVHPYQTIIYLGLFGWGLFALFFTEPVALSEMMPHHLYQTWILMHVIAPFIVWIGQFLHHKDPTAKQTLLGWELQWTGDAAIFFITATTAYAFTQCDSFSYPYISAVFASWALCTLLLSTRDLIAIGYYWGVCRDRKDDADVVN